MTNTTKRKIIAGRKHNYCKNNKGKEKIASSYCGQVKGESFEKYVGKFKIRPTEEHH